MAKHVIYGKTLGIFYEAYRYYCKTILEQGSASNEVPELFRKWFLENVARTIDDVTSIDLFLQDLNHELVHIYMRDEKLLDFLQDIEIKDLEGLKTYIKNNGTKVRLTVDDDFNEISTGVTFAFCLHIPNKKQGYVFSYSLYDNTDELRLFVIHGKEQYHISSNEIINKKSIIYTDREINLITKLSLNLLAYIYCFPECLIEGAPHNIKTENNHYLNIASKIIDNYDNESKGRVIPHFRRGYFKHLNSDFYKNKKGQIIFIHETIVNSQGKTLV